MRKTSPAQRANWQHNSFLGHARMMQTQARSIQSGSLTTERTRALAAHIEELAGELYNSLKTRKEISDATD